MICYRCSECVLISKSIYHASADDFASTVGTTYRSGESQAFNTNLNEPGNGSHKMADDKKTAIIKHAGDGYFIGISPSGHALTIDTKGSRGEAPSPVELLMISLASCTAVDVVSIMAKKRQVVSEYRAEVSGTRREEHPRGFTSFHIHHIVHGRGVSEKAFSDAIRISEEKYCSVAATVRPAAKITTSYEIVEDEE